MNLISVPSLQHATMVKIAIELWNQIDLRDSIVNFGLNRGSRFSWKDWQEVEEKALAKAAQLALPKQLKKELVSVISPIGVEIRNWWVYLRYIFRISKWPNRLSWTSRGTIDKLKTAECLLKDEEMDAYTRYELACAYCMEDVIPVAYERLDNERKQRYIEDVKRSSHPSLAHIWAYHLKGLQSELQMWINNAWTERKSNYLYAFQQANRDGNKTAVEFFLDKLTGQEKERHLYIETVWAATMHSDDIEHLVTPKQHYPEVFLFLLSRMSENQREEVFQNNSKVMLECLLEWPNRPLFVELAERIVQSNPNDVIGLIIKVIVNGYGNCTSRQLFSHIWKLCPLSYKRRAIERIDYCTVVKLHERNEVGIIRALFQHACAVEKEKLIMCRRKLDMTSKRLQFIEGCEPSKEAEVKFRDEFLEHQKD